MRVLELGRNRSTENRYRESSKNPNSRDTEINLREIDRRNPRSRPQGEDEGGIVVSCRNGRRKAKLDIGAEPGPGVNKAQ